MSTPSDLQALFASIKPRPSPSNMATQDSQPHQFHQGSRQQSYEGLGLVPPYRNPSAPSSMYSPGPSKTPPQHSPDVLGPNVPTSRGDQQQQTNDRTVNLLNLLKFSHNTQPVGQQQQQQQPQPQPPTMNFMQSAVQHAQESGAGEPQKTHTKTISASDLVASFMAKPAATTPSSTAAVGSISHHPERDTVGESPPAPQTTTEDMQEMLRRLLNLNRPQYADEPTHPRSQQSPAISSPLKSLVTENNPTNENGTTARLSPTDSAKRDSRMHVFGSGDSQENLNFEVPKPAPPKGGIFTYVNPFAQLAAASSPRNRTPQPKSRSRSGSPAVETIKPKKETSRTWKSDGKMETELLGVPRPGVSVPTFAEVVQQSLSQPTEGKKEKVSEALYDIAGEVDREVEEAPLGEPASQPESAAEGKEETDNDKNQEIVPETLKEDGMADGSPADHWESAEEGVGKEAERVVPVLNFPLKPFISVNVKPRSDKLSSFRDEDGMLDVARLKKEFDQLDRCLTSATSEYIVYALAKIGGIRIIRQDDGSDKQVFRSARDRIFHVTLCTSAATTATPKDQAVLGIGVSGTVYWATIFRSEMDFFQTDTLESESLIFPPYPASDENTSGGQLKTRARRTSRHPELFGIGRGKNIYVIPPHAAMSGDYGVSGSQRTVDIEKFLKERSLKIVTGKAGKDFTFSEDDSVIASLDKTGRVRFWDIREMTDNWKWTQPNAAAPPEVRVPLSTFVTGSPNEKSWPTSVLFIDKLRPYVKSIALRYILVGLRQNHTLQLWDIGLGKAVQELNFPHENESDAICSVAYHPGSGIIVVGHPTRNSIYFVHLSSPRYSVQQMSQAEFIKRSNEKDGSFPKPEATACMSGIREISFASKGQLRSVDLLNKLSNVQRGPEEETLFELYVMYSRGVTCLNIKKEDLGWTSDNKIIQHVDALEDGYIEVNDLPSFPSYVTDEPSVNGDAAANLQKTTSKDIARDAGKDSSKKTSELGVDSASGIVASRNASPTKPSLKKKLNEDQSEAAATNGVDKAPEKKKKKKGSREPSGVTTTIPPIQTTVEASADRRAASPSRTMPPVMEIDDVPTEQPIATNQGPSSATTSAIPPASDQKVDIGIPGEFVKQIEKGVCSEVIRNVGQELDGLYRRFDEDRRAWDAASAAKQDQILRLVSSTLSDNVEKNLARIVSSSIDTEVVPTIVNTTSAALNKLVNDVVSNQLTQTISSEVRTVLEDSVSRTVQQLQPEVINTISDAVSKKLAPHLETNISKVLQSTITPVLKNTALRVEKMGQEIEKQLQAQLKQFEIQRQNDSFKVDQLTTLVRGLSDTVASMAAAQTGYQTEILRLNRRLTSRQIEEENRRVSQVQQPQSQSQPQQPQQAGYPATPSPPRTVEEIELADITQLMHEGRYEEGSVKWLQSSQQADLFDNLFVRVNPTYLNTLSPIVSLSVGVAVTSSLQTNVSERLAWLEVVLQTVNLMDADIREVAPKIMDILIQRLDALYMSTAENNPQDYILRKIPPLSRRAQALRAP